SGDVQLILAGANPVRDRTEIIIETVSEDITSLNLYDIEGNLLKRYINSSLKPGIKLITFESDDYPSGSYRLVLISGNTVKQLTITNLR
ncbi:MAG: T9SS type A sorting domain-containing protein, partial [Chlorobi bacterium]|nr:T9SS type A sorting domain-containing protein [Chlorobiota bacterium]